MICQDHLQQYDLDLTVRGPLYIGSGSSYSKKSYLFLPPEVSRSPGYKVMLLDEAAFFRLLVERGLVDSYEAFMLGPHTDLLRFLISDCHLTMRELSRVSRCTIDAADALGRDRSLKEIHCFIRNAYGQAYVPGSSLKGALRTALLTELVLKDASRKERPLIGDRFPEGRYLHSLALKKDRDGAILDDAVNSILRGLYISDSLPVEDSAMMLSGKIDGDVYGLTHRINLCRECMKPGTKLHFKLTLDSSVLKGRITASSIISSIKSFDRFYEDHWLAAFDSPRQAAPVDWGPYLLLGGGAGYAAKTLVYPYLGDEAGVREVARILDRAFSRHDHLQDDKLGISPRMAKYAQYQGKLYPYGLCEVSLS